MGRTIDRGFAHKIAEEVLKDYPNNESAKEILSKPKYRVNNKYFDTEEELNEYLNSEEYESEHFDNAIRFCDEDCMDYYGGDDYSESLCDFDE